MQANEPRVITLAKDERGHRISPIEAIQRANKQRVVLLSNKHIDDNLVGGKRWKKETDICSILTGTLIAHEKPGKRLGSTIEWVDRSRDVKYTFEVPVEARGERNIALVVNHGFTEDGDPIIEIEHMHKKHFVIHITDKSRMETMQEFPVTEGWHIPDGKFGIPVGPKHNFIKGRMDKDMRNLVYRFPVGIGLVTRHRDPMGLDRAMTRSVDISLPFSTHGALAFETEPGKFQLK
ncbi:MAG: hypothetical protein ABIG39_02870 [Candidatus Micrarchaeota archaeon]